MSLSAQTEVAPTNTNVAANETSAEVESRKQLETLTPALSLTPEQVEQIHNLNIKVAQKIQAIRDNADFDTAKKQEFINGNREDQKRVMQSILTAEQFATYEAMKPTVPQRAERRMEIQDSER